MVLGSSMRWGLLRASTAFSRRARLLPDFRALRFRLFDVLGILQLYPSDSLQFSPQPLAGKSFRAIHIQTVLPE